MDTSFPSMNRRRVLVSGVACLASGLALPASAQLNPGGSGVRMVVPFAAGGGSDVIARIVADGLRDALQEPVIVENRAGAGGNIGALAVAKADPDGRTLLFTPQSPITIAHLLEPKPAFQADKDFTAVSIMARTPLVLLVSSAVPANTMAELVALSKAKPNALFYGSPSPEFAFTTELLAREAGLSLTGVAYKGSGQAMTDLLGGQIQVLLSSAGAAKVQMKSGRVKALALVGSSRLADFPGAQTTEELGLRNFKVFGWFGLFAPAKTPEPILNRLSAVAMGLAKNPAYRDRVEKAGYEALSMDRAASRVAVDEHRAIWKTVAPRVSAKLTS
ncbi:MAG TPA: tripartite tricarboxylate transporter substrate binding protein [Ramlibacter sp.]|nr:tripartite tricarboxylate transporter substrate binding protein [Ramlibacter sp.]